MKFAVLDFETTGTEPQDRIIQVGLALVEEGMAPNVRFLRACRASRFRKRSKA